MDRASDFLHARRYRKCKSPTLACVAHVLTAQQFAIYMATIDYMIAAYGPYAASATGGNGFARDFLAGIAAMYSAPFYELFPRYTLQYPSTILACIAAVVAIPVYIFYFYGSWFRERSPFAQTLAGERKESAGRRASYMALGEEKQMDREKHAGGGAVDGDSSPQEEKVENID